MGEEEEEGGFYGEEKKVKVEKVFMLLSYHI